MSGGIDMSEALQTQDLPPSRPRPSGWRDEDVEQLKALWRLGWSASQISRQLGVTRNAVIGKVHRLALPARPAPPPRPRRAPAARPGPREHAARTPAVRIEPVDWSAVRALEEAPGEATLLTLGPHMCKWPIGDPANEGFTLCGRARATGPYCAVHGRVAYPKGRRRSYLASLEALADKL